MLGHEITHSLIRAGWKKTAGDSKSSTAKCIQEQYNSYLVFLEKEGVQTLDREFTLDENLADIAGLLAAYNAFVKDQEDDKEVRVKGLEQFSNDQLFYIAFAQVPY